MCLGWGRRMSLLPRSDTANHFVGSRERSVSVAVANAMLSLLSPFPSILFLSHSAYLLSILSFCMLFTKILYTV